MLFAKDGVPAAIATLRRRALPGHNRSFDIAGWIVDNAGCG
ncbi:MAG: hypothetical protein V4793_20835 [Paraburkholderia tropica]